MNNTTSGKKPGLNLIVVLAILCPAFIFSQAPTHRVITRFQVHTNINAYWEYLPRDYNQNTTTRYPLIIWMHGYGESGSGTGAAVLDKVLSSSLPRLINRNGFPESFTVNSITSRFIVLSPQIKDGMNVDLRTSTITPATIEAMITHAANNYRIDPGRIYLCGMSMGGAAVLDYLGSSQDATQKIAAAVVTCPAGDLSTSEAAHVGAIGVPILITHNEDDELIPMQRTLNSIANLENHLQGNAPAPLDFYFDQPSPDQYKHDSWTRTFEHFQSNGSNPTVVNFINTDVYSWLLRHARVANAMPVAWRSFTVSIDANAKPLLKWSVTHQVNVERYEVERSGDGKQWTKIADIEASSSSGLQWDYEYRDLNPLSGATQFRIRSVDLDGSFGFSVIRTLRNYDGDSHFTVFASSNRNSAISISFRNLPAKNLLTRFYNVTGQELARKIVYTGNGAGTFELSPGAELSNGVYFLSVTDPSGEILLNKSILKGR